MGQAVRNTRQIHATVNDGRKNHQQAENRGDGLPSDQGGT